MTIKEKWTEQLRAAALEIAENADVIVGDLEKNVSLSVSIDLNTDDEFINVPKFSINRTVFSKKAWAAKIAQFNQKKEMSGDE